MANHTTRSEIASVLQNAGVDFPETASITQLKALLQNVVGAGATGANIGDSTSERAISGTEINAEGGAPPARVEATHEVSLGALEGKVSRLRAQEEILRLRQAIAQLELAPFASYRAVDLNEVQQSIPQFGGDDDHDVRKWAEDFEDLMSSMKVNEAERLRCAKCLLKGTAKLFLHTVRVTSWSELKVALIKRFDQQMSPFELYERLRQRNKKVGESIDRYVIEMCELAQRGNVREVDLVQMIVAGLNDNSVHIAILIGATTIDELLDRIKIYKTSVAAGKRAASAKTSVRSSASGRNSSARNFSQSSVSSSVPSKASGATSGKFFRCFNCSGYGHVASECPAPQRARGSCFKCGASDHLHRDCRRNQHVHDAEANIEPRTDDPNSDDNDSGDLSKPIPIKVWRN